MKKISKLFSTKTWGGLCKSFWFLFEFSMSYLIGYIAGIFILCGYMVFFNSHFEGVIGLQDTIVANLLVICVIVASFAGLTILANYLKELSYDNP